MKSLHIIFIIMLMCYNDIIAQEPLSSLSLFDGRYNNRKGAVEVLVKGKKLKPYNLTLFRSLTLKTDATEIQKISEMVESDAKKATEKETGNIGGKLYYGFFCFGGNKETNQYLFFRNAYLRDKDDPEIIVIYMEGYAKLDEIKIMFE